MVAFSSVARIFGECSNMHSPPALLKEKFNVKISFRTLILLFRPGSVHSGSGAETTVAGCSLTNCVSASFAIGSHTMPE